MNLIKPNNNPKYEQLTLDDLFKQTQSSTPSSDDIAAAIEKLRELHVTAKIREREERERLEREEQERKAREEQDKKDAHIREITCMDLPLEWENVFNADARTQGVHAESPSDALVMSLGTLGRVDIEYMSSITGLDYKEVIGALRGSIYQNPQTWGECFYKGWETADEYLSGNILRKQREAIEANEKYKGYFLENITALKAVLPPAVSVDDIYITLGSPWVPTDVIDDFILHMYKKSRAFFVDSEAVKHDEITGTWEVPFKTRFWHSVTDTKTFGTDRLEALHILERTLNMKSAVVTDEVKCPGNKSGKKRVIDKDETVLALEKQQKMIAEFQKWVWTEKKRKERLQKIYENNYSCVCRRVFDGSFLTFPTMSPGTELYPYQKNAVARILFSQNTLLAHEVGSGKTYVMIAAGNRTTDKSVAFKMPKALANRLLHIEVEGSFSSWKEWAIQSGINDKVVGFLSFRQQHLMCFDAASDDLAFATPRAWEMVSNILNHVDNDVDKMYFLIAGVIGTGLAIEFRTWAKVYDELPELEDIFDGKQPPLPTGTDAMYALCSAMTAFAREHKDDLRRIANSVKYADRMPPDFSTVLLKDYMYIEPDYRTKLLRIPEFSAWLSTKGRLLNGSV